MFSLVYLIFFSYLCTSYVHTIMNNKDIYIEWAKGQIDMPVFMQPWWMDAVCAGKQWDVMLYPADATEPSQVLAAMPYLLRKRWNDKLRYILMPQQTQIGGIWIGNAQVNVNAAMVSFNEQLSQLGLQYYYQQYPIGSPCPAALSSLGYTVHERTTYRIEDLSNLDAVIDHFTKNKKRQLQKALSLHAEHDRINAEQFYRFHTHCLVSRRQHISYSREFFLVLEQKTRRLSQSEILTICNADGDIYAAAFLVWDNRSLYYLIPCLDMEQKESGAGALLALEAIKVAREKGVAMDFEGGTMSGVASHYKQFGTTKTSYFAVERYYKRWFRLAIFWNWINGLRYR